MIMTNCKVFGERILVEKLMTPGKSVLDKAEFRGEVLVLAIGEEAKGWGINTNDRLIVSGTMDFNEEVYVHRNQILRWVCYNI